MRDGSGRADEDPDLASTAQLLERFRAGDLRAVEMVLARYVPALRRWTHGRLPIWARDLLSTDDVVQEAVLRTIQNLGSFEMRHDGALRMYLRQAVQNRIQDEIRRLRARPPAESIDTMEVDRAPSPLEEAIGSRLLARYEDAMKRLSPEDRQAIIARVEMGASYAEVAEALGKASPDAARMAVSRALVRLAEEMGHGR